MKKLIIKLLTIFILSNVIIAHAGNTVWDLDIDTEYTIGDPASTEITGGLGQLKFQLIHKSSLINGAGGALLNNPEGILVDGNYAYIASAVSDAVEIINISDPNNPIHAASIANGAGGALLDDPRAIAKSGNYLFVAVNISDAIEVIDISNPLSPTHAASISDGGTTYLNGTRGLTIVGNYLYATSYVDDALEIIDISNPLSPIHIGSLRSTSRLNGAQGIDVVGNYAYVTSDRDDSLQIIDISNPASPSFVGEIVNGTALLNGPRDVKVVGNYAYVVSTVSDSLEIIDISNPSNPTHVSSLADDTIMELNGARDIIIEGDYAYITAHDDDGLEIINISDPNNPIHSNSITDGGTMELNGATTLTKVGNYIYVGGRVDDGFEILEVGYTNTSPYIISNNALVYSGSIDQITTTYGGSNQGDITYQISKDNGITWYYLSGINRLVTTAGTSESNTPAEINYEIQSFNGLAGGTGEFIWKAFLNGDGIQKVELDEVSVDSTSAGINEIIDFELPGGYSVTNGTWTRQSTTVYEGVFSIESDNGGANNSSSCFDVDRTIYNDSTISFFKSVDSEATYDFLRFYIDGIQQDEWSGALGWTQENYDVGNGTHNFQWCYEKDGSVNTGADTAWVDYIEIIEKPITPPPVITDIIDFETATGYTITGGIWNRQSTTVYEGTFSIEADNLGVNNSTSCFETTRNLTKDSTISFFRSIDSEATYDFLKFYVDGGLRGQWSGNLGWLQESYAITAGLRTFSWCYEKDASVSNGADTAWVDYIEITEDPNPPVEIPVLDFEIVGGYTVTTAVTTPGPDWERVTTEKYEGLWSIESQNQAMANSSSCFERVQTVGPIDTGISFYKKVSSIAAWPDWDHLVFYIDNVEKTRWSGSAGRSRELYNLSPGTYTLKWCYEKNGTGDDSIDKAWVDLVSVTQDSPILTEITPVLTPTNDNTPDYTFYSPIAGDIIYGGFCTSTTDKAVIGNNTIIFNSLTDGIYTNCTIQVLGSSSNSTVLAVSNFTIDTTRITNTINYPIDTSTIANKSFDFDVSYSDDSGVDIGSIILKLYKFDDVGGTYGSDISGTYVDFVGATIGGTGAIYPVSQLGAGQFKIDFTISDTLGNDSTTSTEFFIDLSPLTLTTTVNNSGGGVFNYEFTIENTSLDNITNWVVGFQLNGGVIDISSGGTFSNAGNLFQIVSNSPTTDTFTPGQTHTISFSGTGNGIVTDLYLISYTNASPEVPIDYNLSQNGLDVAVTTTSIIGNEYCRNIALTNNGTEDITAWQLTFELNQILSSTSNATFSKAGIVHTIDPLGNANILVGNTENISFCTDGLKADNNWLITLVTLSLGDIIAPTISSTNPIEGETKITGTFDFIFNYSDDVLGDGIDITSDEIYLYKWNGSAYGTDIAATHIFLGSKTVTTSTASYPSNNITDGQYKVIFKIFDLNNNFVTTSIVFYVGIPPSDTTSPDIINSFPTNGILYPNANFDISINYSDSESNINTNSINLDIQKWDGSIYGPDLELIYVSGSSVTSTNAIYNITKMGFGKYKIYFYIEDEHGNGGSSSIEFYIDEPELIISTGALDIGLLENGVTKFSTGELNITVKTVGAGFDIMLNKTSTLLNGAIEIIDWNTSEGVGFEKAPYSSTINIINTNEVIATQGTNININGNKNTYNYSIKLGALVGEEQAAGNYSGDIKFGIDLNY